MASCDDPHGIDRLGNARLRHEHLGPFRQQLEVGRRRGSKLSRPARKIRIDDLARFVDAQAHAERRLDT